MIKIIKAEQKHISELTRLGYYTVRKAHVEAAPEEHLNAYLNANYTEEAIANELANTDNVYRLMFDGDRMIGFSKIVYNQKNDFLSDPKVTKLDRIYLHEDYHGHGLAQQLLAFNIDLARKNGQSAIWLYTWVGNKRAIAFYKKEGFDVIGEHMFRVSADHSNPNWVLAFEILK